MALIVNVNEIKKTGAAASLGVVRDQSVKIAINSDERLTQISNKYANEMETVNPVSAPLEIRKAMNRIEQQMMINLNISKAYDDLVKKMAAQNYRDQA